jgi:hypothetical protein
MEAHLEHGRGAHAGLFDAVCFLRRYVHDAPSPQHVHAHLHESTSAHELYR